MSNYNSEMTFSSLVLGLSSAALSYLGYDKDSDQPSADLDLELARQNIDILAVLEEKSAGNLTPDEERLLRTVLTDLRSKYLETSKKLAIS